MFFNYNKKYVDGIIKLWNNSAVRDGYKELDSESFERIFKNPRYFKPDNFFILVEDDVCGFACGCTGDDLPLGETSGYLTCIILSPENQTKERFSMLLGLLEDSFKKQGKKQSEVLFFNPMMLPWYIPNTPGHEHNNAPGVPVDTPYYGFLLENGYRERARECAMYLNLKGFALSEEIIKKEARAKEKGYTVTMFDAERHSGVCEMLQALENPLWQTEIIKCTKENIPVIVAALGGKTVGFAGPVIRQENGRGYFTGIGVMKEHEGSGLGSILFSRLCEALKDVGAEYMSLYTGLNNPAIKIYERAGFVPVREFAVMRKEF